MAIFYPRKQWQKRQSRRTPENEASLQQLIVLSNMENLNAEFIRQGLPQPERLLRVNASAKQMMRSLLDSAGVERLKRLEPPKE